MALTTTKITDFIDTEGYANSFYGTYDHYQRIGWYFDLIVDSLEDLNSIQAQAIMAGRFVLVKDEDAIFMRSGNNGTYKYTPYEIIEKENELYYSPGATQTVTTNGFRFIGYASRKALLLLNKDSYVKVDAMDAYKIADTDTVRTISAFYFPTEYNESFQR